MHLLISGEAVMFRSRKHWMPTSSWSIVGIKDMASGQKLRGRAMSFVYNGSIMGDSDMIFGTARVTNVVARTPCTTLALTRAAYDTVLSRFPSDAEQIAVNVQRLVRSKAALKMDPRVAAMPQLFQVLPPGGSLAAPLSGSSVRGFKRVPSFGLGRQQNSGGGQAASLVQG